MKVEAALTNDPENDDLVKLKNDLEEVIHLTQELVDSQVSRTMEWRGVDGDLEGVGGGEKCKDQQPSEED